MKSLKIYYSDKEKSEIKYTNQAQLKLLEKHAKEIIAHNENIQTIAIFENNSLRGTIGRLTKV